MTKATLVALFLIAVGSSAHAQTKSPTCAWGCAYAHPTAQDMQARTNVAVQEFMANHGLLGVAPNVYNVVSTVNNIGNWFQSDINAVNSTVTVTSGQGIHGGNSQTGNASAKTFTGNNTGLSTKDIVNFK